MTIESRWITVDRGRPERGVAPDAQPRRRAPGLRDSGSRSQPRANAGDRARARSRARPEQSLRRPPAPHRKPGRQLREMGPSPQRRRLARWLGSGLWSRSVSVARSAPVRAMDADVMITLAFCLEVVLLGLAAWIFIVRELRTARGKPATACGGEPGFPRPPARADDVKAADTGRLVTGPSHRAVRCVRS